MFDLVPQIARPQLYLDGKPVELPEDKLGSVGRLRG